LVNETKTKELSQEKNEDHDENLSKKIKTNFLVLRKVLCEHGHLCTTILSISLRCVALLWSQDGYAVLASDGTGDFEIIGDARCGDSPDFAVKSGTVAYITTGGTCIPVEFFKLDGK
jgi:hypothetical protein